jgi:hypothetical protein
MKPQETKHDYLFDSICYVFDHASDIGEEYGMNLGHVLFSYIDKNTCNEYTVNAIWSILNQYDLPKEAFVNIQQSLRNALSAPSEIVYKCVYCGKTMASKKGCTKLVEKECCTQHCYDQLYANKIIHTCS